MVEKTTKKLYRMVFSKYKKGGFWLTLCGLTIYGHADTDMRIRICRHGYADTDTRIRISGYTDTDTRIRIRGYGYAGYGYADTDMRICGQYLYICHILLYYTILCPSRPWRPPGPARPRGAERSGGGPAGSPWGSVPQVASWFRMLPGYFSM